MDEQRSLFSKKELNYLVDRDFLITKHEISSKILIILKEVEFKIKNTIKTHNLKFPEKVLSKAGKISKGENYQLLPYQILDFPRYFHSNSTFAFRTMFWWGNFFSCTLHLQGEILNNYRIQLEEGIENIRDKNYFLSIAPTPWEYHYQPQNYQPLEKIHPLELKEILKNKPFIKISRNIDLSKHQQVPQFAVSTFIELMNMLRNNN